MAPTPLASLAAAESLEEAYVRYDALRWGKRNFPLLVADASDPPELPLRGWSLTFLPCADGTATGSFVDPMGGSGPYSWSVLPEHVMLGAVPDAYDLFVVQVRPCDHRYNRERWNDYRIFFNGHINEVVTGALGRVRGLANLGIDVRVYTIFVDERTEWETLAAAIPSKEIARARLSCLLNYAWPSTAAAPDATRGMFRSDGVYRFLEAAAGMLRVAIPGMPTALYKALTAKSYHADAGLASHMAPTVAVRREGFHADPEGSAAAVIASLGERVFVKRGNSWGGSGTHAVAGTEGLVATLLTAFREEPGADVLYAQQMVPGVVAEMRSVRFFARGKTASRVVFMRLEERPSGETMTGPRSLKEAEVLPLVFGDDAAKHDGALRQMERIAELADAFCARFGPLPTDYRVDALLDCEDRVWLVELTEQNASLCGLPPQARFDSLVHSLLGDRHLPEFDLRPFYG